MKYFIALLLGAAVGAAVFIVAVAYNPLLETQQVSPLTVTDARTAVFSYSAVPSDNLVLTNDGLQRRDPWPEDVLQLWERPIRQSEVMATVLHDARNQPAGLGIKFSSSSERTRVLNGELLVDSAWYIYVPGRGSLFVEQYENYWDYTRDIVIPAYRSSANAWKGNWLGNLTAGPGSLRTARVTGGSGEFAGHEMIGSESLIMKVWSVDDGAALAEGRLIIELPEIDVTDADQT
ncbi:MAG: hypothetical protein AAFN50_04200 [Pseudomonadota bacterium]